LEEANVKELCHVHLSKADTAVTEALKYLDGLVTSIVDMDQLWPVIDVVQDHCLVVTSHTLAQPHSLEK
jgi:hypothetical protein